MRLRRRSRKSAGFRASLTRFYLIFIHFRRLPWKISRFLRISFLILPHYCVTSSFSKKLFYDSQKGCRFLSHLMRQKLDDKQSEVLIMKKIWTPKLLISSDHQRRLLLVAISQTFQILLNLFHFASAKTLYPFKFNFYFIICHYFLCQFFFLQMVGTICSISSPRMFSQTFEVSYGYFNFGLVIEI